MREIIENTLSIYLSSLMKRCRMEDQRNCKKSKIFFLIKNLKLVGVTVIGLYVVCGMATLKIVQNKRLNSEEAKVFFPQ